jgi:hypothetical protein
VSSTTVSKTIVIKEQRELACDLVPLQAGVGMQGGSEFVIHSVRQLLHANSQWAAVMVDCTNAYGSIYRDKIQNCIPPSLCAKYYNTHCNNTLRVLTLRELSIEVVEGVAQGDPLSPLLFAKTLQQALVKLQATLDEQQQGGRIFACLDDVIIVAPASVLSSALNTY